MGPSWRSASVNQPSFSVTAVSVFVWVLGPGGLITAIASRTAGRVGLGLGTIDRWARRRRLPARAARAELDPDQDADGHQQPR